MFFTLLVLWGCSHGPTTSELLESTPDLEDQMCLDSDSAAEVVQANDAHNCGAVFKGSAERAEGASCKIEGETSVDFYFDDNDVLVGQIIVIGSVCGWPSGPDDIMVLNDLCIEESGLIIGIFTSKIVNLGLVGEISFVDDNYQINGEIWKLHSDESPNGASSPWGEDMLPKELLGTYSGEYRDNFYLETSECYEYMEQ